ncbi:MAG: DUF6382 domain-containing protein [Faecalibacterium sp.]
MQEYKIITQGSSTYLESRILADEQVDEIDCGMLTSNQIIGLLPLSIQWINGECRLLYNITGLTQMKHAERILENEQRLANFFISLSKMEKECDEYLLDPNKIDLEQGYIYLDLAGKAFALYRPTIQVRNTYQPINLVHEVFRMVGRRLPSNSRIVSALSKQLLYGDKISFSELEQEIQNSEVQSSGAVETPPAEFPSAAERCPGPGPRPEPRYEAGKTAQPSWDMPEEKRAELPNVPSVVSPDKGMDNPFADAANRTDGTSTPALEKKREPDKPKKEKKEKGSFFSRFGKKDKKKSEVPPKENPFQQEKCTLPEQPQPPAFVPSRPVSAPEPVGGQTVVLTDKGANVSQGTQIMGTGQEVGGDLYLVQKSTNQYIHITHSNFHIGRAKDVVDYTVQTQTTFLGNDHAYILIENGTYYIKDNNTRNHTYVNEKQVMPSQKVPIYPGDMIRMADIVFTVVG